MAVSLSTDEAVFILIVKHRLYSGSYYYLWEWLTERENIPVAERRLHSELYSYLASTCKTITDAYWLHSYASYLYNHLRPYQQKRILQWMIDSNFSVTPRS